MSYTGSNTIHASFNWNPAYDSYKHVALWGNDATGDGTKKYPYKTIAKAVSTTGTNNLVIGAGVYRESLPTWSGNTIMVADGNVIIDVSVSVFATNPPQVYYTGITFRGLGASPIYTTGGAYIGLTNCTLDGALFNTSTNIWNLNSGNVFKNITALLSIPSGAQSSYNTFYNCSNINHNIGASKSIFSNCTFSNLGTGSNVFTYCDFYNCYIKFNSSGTSTLYTTYAAFSAAFVAAGGTAANLIVLYFVDPLFCNPSIGDLTLQISSPAKNMFDGAIIGATLIGTSLVGNTAANASAFDNGSLVNMTIDATTGALTMTSTAAIAQATTKPIANLAGRNIDKLTTIGFYADRNGQYIDATTDLDNTGLYASGDALTADRIYLVDASGGQIIYNGITLAVGDRFTCKAAATSFTNVSVAGFVREIIEGPTRNNIEARFSNGTGNFKNNGDGLTSGYWYYLSTGTATHSGVNYTAGQFIKGDGTNVTLSGTLEEVFTTDSYQYYESFGSLTCNRAGNVFTGSITKGNGDPSFDRTAANVFKIASKFIQIRYTIQYNNLTP